MLIDGAEGKKNFDGSYTYTVDVSKKDFNDYVQIQKWWNKEYSTLVSLTVEFHKQYTFLNYTEFKRVYNNLQSLFQETIKIYIYLLYLNFSLCYYYLFK